MTSTNTAKERWNDNLSTHFINGYAPAALTSETRAIFKGKRKDDRTGLKCFSALFFMWWMLTTCIIVGRHACCWSNRSARPRVSPSLPQRQHPRHTASSKLDDSTSWHATASLPLTSSPRRFRHAQRLHAARRPKVRQQHNVLSFTSFINKYNWIFFYRFTSQQERVMMQEYTDKTIAPSHMFHTDTTGSESNAWLTRSRVSR